MPILISIDGSFRSTGSMTPRRIISCKALSSEPSSSSSSKLTGDVADLVEQWLRIDSDAATSDQIRGMALDGQEAELLDILGARLQFGELIILSYISE